MLNLLSCLRLKKGLYSVLNLLSCLRKVIFLKTEILKRAFSGKAVFEVTVKFFAKTVKKCCFCQPVRVKSSGCRLVMN